MTLQLSNLDCISRQWKPESSSDSLTQNAKQLTLSRNLTAYLHKFALLRKSQFQFQGKKKQRCPKASWCAAADRRLLLDSVHHPAPQRKFWANREGADFSEHISCFVPTAPGKLIWQQRCLSINYLSCSSSEMTPNICFLFCVGFFSSLWHWSQFAQD